MAKNKKLHILCRKHNNLVGCCGEKWTPGNERFITPLAFEKGLKRPVYNTGLCLKCMGCCVKYGVPFGSEDDQVMKAPKGALTKKGEKRQKELEEMMSRQEKK